MCIPLFPPSLHPSRYHEYVGSQSGDMRSMVQGVFTVPALFAEKAVELIVAHFSEKVERRIVVPTADPESGDWTVFDESQCVTSA